MGSARSDETFTFLQWYCVNVSLINLSNVKGLTPISLSKENVISVKTYRKR